MADPTTPTQSEMETLGDVADRTSKAFDALEKSSASSGESIGTLGEFANKAHNAFDAFNGTLTAYGVSMTSSMSLTDRQTKQFGLLSSAMLGARDSFNNLSGIDTSNLNTFSDQVQYLTSSFTDAQSGMGQLVNFAREAFGTIVPQAIVGQGIPAVQGFVLNLAQSADTALKVQNAYIQLSAKTGNLSNVFAAAGPNLENLNILLEKQTALITSSGKATGLQPEIIENYYSQLGTIPKALEENVRVGAAANDVVNMLTASIKLSSGTGRSYSDIIADLTTAYKDYNLVGEPALQFTARISEVSNKLGVNLEVVRDSLRSTAGVFKMFGNEAEASARILNNYVGALQSTGLSGDAAVDVVTSMTHAMKDMNIAQKSFLSSQTGGSGGLMGAFQIEKMMRDGKLDEVFEKVRTQMQKQFGSIVNLEEASTSQSAASQLTKQMMTLKQGPLGQFAKSDQEAIRILEGFRAKQEGRVGGGELSSRPVQDLMDKGTTIQDKSYTELTRIRAIMEGFRMSASVANLGSVQQAFAISGDGSTLSESQRKSKENLSSFRDNSGLEGGRIGSDYARDVLTKSPVSDIGRRLVSSTMEFYKLFQDIPDSMQAPLDTLTSAVSNGTTLTKSAQLRLLEDIEKAKAEVERKPQGEKETALRIISEQEASVRGYSSAAVGSAASRVVGMRAPGSSDASKQAAQQSTEQVPSKMGDITVHVTGYCLKCKQDIEGGQQAAAINPAGMR